MEEGLDHSKESHYNQGNIECIDAMESAFGRQAVINFCHLNVFKYVWRLNEKGNVIDNIDKAINYLKIMKNMIQNDPY